MADDSYDGKASKKLKPNKKLKPKDFKIEDIIEANMNPFGKKGKIWESHAANEISKRAEENVQSYFIDAVKIKETTTSTPDFITSNKVCIIEVTSPIRVGKFDKESTEKNGLQTNYVLEESMINTLNDAIKHAESKDLDYVYTKYAIDSHKSPVYIVAIELLSIVFFKQKIDDAVKSMNLNFSELKIDGIMIVQKVSNLPYHSPLLYCEKPELFKNGVFVKKPKFCACK